MITRWKLSPIHLPGVNHHGQPALGCGAQQAYWEGRNDACPPHYTRLREPQALYKEKYGSVQRLRHQYTAVRQWNLDHLRPVGKEIQHLPPALPSANSSHILARQGSQGNTEVLSRAGLPSMYTILRQRRRVCAEWVMCAVWRMAVLPRTSSTVN